MASLLRRAALALLLGGALACDPEPSAVEDAGRTRPRDASVRDAGSESPPADGAAPTEDAGAPGLDANIGPLDGGPDGAGVPIFVAAGYGGRTLISCDEGETWVADDVLENASDDHSQYTDKGLVYGNGRFVLLMGWGVASRVKVSEDGVVWREHGLGGQYGGGIAFAGGRFFVVGNYSCQSSLDAETWVPCSAYPTIEPNVRDVGGGGPAPGRLALGGTGSMLYFTWDGGESFAVATACGAMGEFGNLGQEGGTGWIGGGLVAVASDGRTCRSTDGSTFVTGNVGSSVHGRVTVNGGRMFAPNGTGLRVTTDGESWVPANPDLPPGSSIQALACNDASDACVAIDGSSSTRILRSSDGGASFEARTIGASDALIRRVTFGRGAASALCP